MELNGEYRFNASRQKVWDLLNDPEFVASAIPGAKNLSVEGPGKYRAEVSVGMGFIRGKFTGTVETTDMREPESYRLNAEGKGAIGSVQGDGDVKLTEIAPDQTMVAISGTAHVSGLIGRAGDKALRGAAQSLMDKFFEKLSKETDKRA